MNEAKSEPIVSESPSESSSITATKEGPLTLRKGKYKGKKKKLVLNKKWGEVYVSLVSGSLHCYNHLRDPTPKETIELAEIKVVTTPPEEFTALKFVFVLSGEKEDYIFKAEEENDMEEWISAIKEGTTKPPHSPLKKDKSAKLGLKNRMERNVIGHAATSPLGKRAIRSKAPKEVTELISAMKVIVEKESGSAKKANEIEETIFKVGVKIFYLLQKGQIAWGEVLVADEPLRQALSLFIRCRNHVIDRTETTRRRQTLSIDVQQLRQKLQEVSRLVTDAADKLKKVLAPHLTAKSLKRIDFLVAYAGDPFVLYKIVMDRSMQEEVYELVSAGEHYSQFHFYAEDL